MADDPRQAGDLYWSLVEPVWDEIDIYEGPEVFARTFAAALEPARLLYAAHFCQSEVRNGGFNQFFWNSTGVLAPEAIEGFKAIGQNLVSEIIQGACSLFGDDFPRDRSYRRTRLAMIDSSLLDALDRKFYKIIDEENGGFDAAADGYAARYARPRES